MQADGGRVAALEPFAVHLLAQEAVAAPPRAPAPPRHRERAFGHHDLSTVRAHIGGAAAAATTGSGTPAFAFGADVACAASPDLRQRRPRGRPRRAAAPAAPCTAAEPGR
ncbi:MAG: DUF4157 domain-containing protein [Kofleriaceae bacterium]|nr:DUF4157 domain-containing protein [Kofleriaceae bacterium]